MGLLFVMTHATKIGVTHADDEKHRIPGTVTIRETAPRIRAAEGRAILSSDSGAALLPPPVEAFREFLLLAMSEDVFESEIWRLTQENPVALFEITGNA